MTIRISKDLDRAASLFICVYLLANAINSCIQDVFSLSSGQVQIFKYLLMFILVVFLLNAIRCMTIKQILLFIFAEAVMALLYVYSWLFGVSMSRLGDWWLTATSVCIPMFYCAYLISDFHILYRRLLTFSWPILVVLFVDMFGNTSSLYDMHFSYSILLILLIHVSEFAINRRPLYLIFSLIEVVMLVSNGSRGALICLAVFLVFKIFTNVESNRIKIIWVAVIVILVGTGFYLLNAYGPRLYNYLVSRGISSRTLRLLLNGDFVGYDSGRMDIWTNTIQLIRLRPLVGWGIRGAAERLGSPYPHNLFLDLPLTFGMPIGIIIAMAILYSLRTVFISPNSLGKNLLQIFVCHAFVSLMFSGTVFTNYYFFIMLGLALNHANHKDKKRSSMNLMRNQSQNIQ